MKKLKQHLTTIMIFIMVVVSYGQDSTYSMSYDIGGVNNVGAGMTKDESQNIYIMDWASCGETQFECINITKFDRNGLFKWTNTYDFETGYQYHGGGAGCIKVANGIIAIVGDEEARPNYDRYFMGFWDTSGVFMDTFFYDFPFQEDVSFVRALTQKDDSTYFVLGGETLGPFRHTLFISKILRDGRELWRKHYGDGQDWLPDPETIDIYRDSMLLFSTTQKYDVPPQTRNAILLCTDLDGNLVWQDEVIGDNMWTDWARTKSRPIGDSDIIYSFGEDSTRFFTTRPIIVRLNENRNEQWRQYFQFENSTKTIDNIHVTSNDNIVGVGSKTVRWDPENGMSLTSIGWAFRLTPNGEVKWIRDLIHTENFDNSQSLLNVEEQNNGYLFMSGSIIDTTGTGLRNQNTWVVRLDSNGNCFGENCPQIKEVFTSVIEVTQNNAVRNITLYPNPVIDLFSMIGDFRNISRMTLHDINGRLCSMWKFDVAPVEGDFNIGYLSSGLYIVSFYDGKGVLVGSGKIQKE